MSLCPSMCVSSLGIKFVTYLKFGEWFVQDHLKAIYSSYCDDYEATIKAFEDFSDKDLDAFLYQFEQNEPCLFEFVS